MKAINYFTAFRGGGIALLYLIFSTLLAMPVKLCGQPIDYSLPLTTLQVTSPFGYRVHPITGQYTHHNGVDLAARSDLVFTVLSGRVKAVGTDPLLGQYLRITHGEIESIYGHLSEVLVAAGDPVSAGQTVGITGKTGRATGEHLHFSIKFAGAFLDPLKFLYQLKLQSIIHHP